jgi:hypothetical protein
LFLFRSGEKILGKILIDFNQLVRDSNMESRWYIIYGPQRAENSFMKNLNYQWGMWKEVEPYFYFGRVLASAKWIPDENPTKIKYDIPPIVPPNEIEYVFWLDIYELTSEPLGVSDNIFFEFQVADIIKEKQATYNSNLKKFYLKDKEKRFHAERISLPVEVSQIPDIFIRVFKKNTGMFGGASNKDYIGYKRFKIADLIQNKWAVKTRWEKMRMCYTTVKGDSEDNYLGLILCSVNLFVLRADDDVHKRPILNETNTFKKFKLISVIYMANELPVSSSALPKGFVKISFNGVNKRTNPLEEGNLNPIWGESLYISTLLNDSVELSEHIKMELYDESSMLGSNYIGQAEIPITSIQKYNHQTYIDHEIFKLAKWYHLYHGTNQLKTKILAAFFLVKLIKQGPEVVKLQGKDIWPENSSFRMYLCVIGVRQVPKSIDLSKGYVIPKYFKKLEKLSESKERFLYHKDKGYEMKYKKGIYDNNFNNIDILKDSGMEYKKISIQNHTHFILPLELLVYNENDQVKLSTTIDISRYYLNNIRFLNPNDIQLLDNNNKKDKNIHLQPTKKENFVEKKIQTIRKKKNDFVPSAEDLIPLYKEDLREGHLTDKYIKLYQKTMESFPFEVDDVYNNLF